LTQILFADNRALAQLSERHEMSVDPRAILAAKNNADLYAAMSASQRLGYERLTHAFVGRDRPLPYYSNLTVLAPGHADKIAAQLRALAQTFDGVIGVKDSFCELDLQANGFEILFGASWIWCEAGLQPSSHSWERIGDAAGLALWEEAWKQSGSPMPERMFTPELLRRPEIVFLGQRADGEIQSGCIANVSESCVGISNVFSRTPSDGVFAQATAAVASVAPQLPIAGL
jgi:hypothetical protein